MPKSLSLDEAYKQCSRDGKYIPQQEVNWDKIRSMLNIIEEDLATIQELKHKKGRWNTLYKLSYDVLHTLVEGMLVFDNVKSLNHQCLFAYLCKKHPELELDFDFFERIRTKRNGIHYYGTGVIESDWKEVELQFSLYGALLKKKVEKRLEKSS